MIAAKVDMRPALSKVGTQGRRPCCLAFAASTAHEHSLRNGTNLSIEYLHFHAVARSPGADPHAGAGMDAVAEALFNDGQPLAGAWPYGKVQLVPPAWAPPKDVGMLYRAEAEVGLLSTKEICEQLDGGNAVVLGLIITQRFRKPDEMGRIRAANDDAERGPHAVLAVGHGTDESGEVYVLIRNSWGSGWALDGHAWVSEAYLGRQLCETAVIVKRAS